MKMIIIFVLFTVCGLLNCVEEYQVTLVSDSVENGIRTAKLKVDLPQNAKYQPDIDNIAVNAPEPSRS
jgi:hypothetical protein